MSDLSTLSNDDLLAQMQAAQQRQNAAMMQHTTAPAPSGFLLHDPTEGMSTFDKVAAGTGRGMIHTGRSIGNLVGAVPDSVMTDEKQIDAPLLNTTPGKWGNILGETAVTAPIGMGTTALMGNAGKLAAALAANPISNAAVQGGIQGALTSDPGERGQNATMGALTGAGLATGGSLAGKLINGLTKSPEAAELIKQGIQLTPGQLNPDGIANQMEQAGEHIWGVGPLIKNARDNAEHQFQATVIGKGAAPGAAPIRPSDNIHDMLQQAYDSYAPLYDQAKGFPVKPAVMNGRQGVKLSALFDQASKAPGTTEAGQKAAKSFLDNELTRLPANPSSTDLLTLRSNIRTAARNAKLSNDTIAGDKANIFGLADDHVTRALNSQLPPTPLTALRSADSKYGTYKIVEDAVAKAKDNIAGLTPQKLSQAVYNQTPDPAYARGAGGPLRDLAQQGTQVFQTTVPPTGAALGTMGGMGLLAMSHPAVGATVGTGLGALTLTPTGRRLAAGMTGPQQGAQKLIEALRGNVPTPLRNVGSQLALSGATRAGVPVTQAALPQALAAALMLAPPVAQPASR